MHCKKLRTLNGQNSCRLATSPIFLSYDDPRSTRLRRCAAAELTTALFPAPGSPISTRPAFDRSVIPTMLFKRITGITQ